MNGSSEGSDTFALDDWTSVPDHVAAGTRHKQYWFLFVQDNYVTAIYDNVTMILGIF